MITRDLIKYPDQFVTVLNALVKRIEVLEMEVNKLKKEKN